MLALLYLKHQLEKTGMLLWQILQDNKHRTLFAKVSPIFMIIKNMVNFFI